MRGKSREPQWGLAETPEVTELIESVSRRVYRKYHHWVTYDDVFQQGAMAVAMTPDLWRVAQPLNGPLLYYRLYNDLTKYANKCVKELDHASFDEAFEEQPVRLFDREGTLRGGSTSEDIT